MTDAEHPDLTNHSEASLQRKIDELTALNRIMRAVSIRLDPSIVIDAAFTETMRILKPDFVMLFLTEGGNLMLQTSRFAPSVHPSPDIPQHKVGECLCGLAVSTGEAIYSIDIQHDPRCTWHECKDMGMSSAATLPLREGDHVFGVFVIASRIVRDFAQDRAFLETLSGQFAACLKNAMLHQQLQEQIETQTALSAARAQLQGELAVNEERFRLAMEATTDGLWDWNVATDASYFSPAYYRMLHYEPDEFPMTGEAWLTHIHPEDRDQALRANMDCIEGRTEAFEVEFRMQTKGGGWKWILGRGKAVLRGSEGRALRIVGTHVDITERKLRERELSEQEARLRAIVNNAPFGAHSYELTPENTLIFKGFNEAAVHILGISHNGLIGKSIEEAFPLLITTSIPETYREVARRGISREFDQILYNDGAVHGAFEVHAFQTGMNRMTAFFRDISERKRSEAALQESEQRFRFAVQNAPAVFFILDRNGVFLLSEGRALSRLHLAPGEVVGKSALDLYKDFPSVSSSILRALQGDVVRVINDLNGVIFDSVYSPYHNADGSLAGVIGVAVDITEQKKLEQQLFRAQKMEAIGTLAGGVAHDFNNLLTSMLGYTSLMLHDTAEKHPHYQKLKIIESQIQSASALTRQLLGFARGGKYEVKPADLNELIKSTSEMFGRTRKELSISFRLQPDLRPAEVDRVQIEQVLMNLYVNAWQAMPHGGALFLMTENVVLDDQYCRHQGIRQGAYIKLSVTDTGSGMDEETQSRIFEPFFTTKEKSIGTGLGLASSYGIIRNHGGVINVYSEVGKGSTFTIFLPASLREIEKTQAVPKGLVAGVGTILLVDDQQIVSEVGAEMLSTLGYDVISAGSGEDAVRLYAEQKEHILLVLLDMIMPGMSGAETFERLKQINPDVRVILSSGYSIDGQASEIINKGCRGFIQKPFNLQDLSRKIDLALKQ